MVLSPSYIHTNKAKFTPRLPMSHTLYILNTETVLGSYHKQVTSVCMLLCYNNYVHIEME